ncbi:unnamed protein product [Urochloa humidicola]
MAATIARLLARRGCATGVVARRTVGGSTPTAIVTRRASTGKEVAPPPPTSNLIWLKNAIDQFDHRATLEIQALERERRALERIYFTNKASYELAVSEAQRVSSRRILMVVASFAMISYHLVQEAEHRAFEGTESAE